MRTMLAVIAAMMAAVAGLPAAAQGYPTQPVRIVVPYPPGGSTDILARLLSQKLTQSLGQPVIVDNRPGANGGIAAQHVAKAAPDGHTILFGSEPVNAINHALYKSLPFDSERDFAAIAPFALVPFILVVNPALPVRSVDDLIRLGRSQSGQLNFASVGIGSASHLGGEMLNLAAGTRFIHIPYKGGATAIPATISGEVAFMFATGLEGTPHVESGKLRGIGITTRARSPIFPNLPTLAESGLPGFELSAWFGLLAPKGTPPAVIDRLNREIANSLADDGVKKRLAELSTLPYHLKPDEFASKLSADIVRWRRIVKETGARSD